MTSPCEQCITRPICRNQINDMYKPDVTQFSMLKDCELLKEFIQLEGEDNEREIDEARDTLGLERLYEYKYK